MTQPRWSAALLPCILRSVCWRTPATAAKVTAPAMGCCTPGDVRLFTDADLSSPIYEAGKLFEAIGQGADIAIGSRWLQAELQTERQPWHRQLYGRLFNLGLRIVLGLKYRDTQCGFKAFTRAAVQTIFSRQHVERWGFDPELLFLADKFKLRTVEVPVEW